MASTHVAAVSHLVVLVLGLTLIVSLLRRSLRRGHRVRVRSDELPPRRQTARALRRWGACLVRATGRLVAGLVLVLVTPLGLLCANRRYPVVAPVLAPCEEHLTALGHRIGHARCFPLLVCTLWLVRCAGCRRHSLFREVPAAGGTAVDLQVIGHSPWRTRRCPIQYLTAQPAQATAVVPARPIHARRPGRRRVSGGQAPRPASAPLSPSGMTDRTA